MRKFLLFLFFSFLLFPIYLLNAKEMEKYDLMRPINEPIALSLKDLENPYIIAGVLKKISNEIKRNPQNRFLWKLRFEYSLIYWDLLPPDKKEAFSKIAYNWAKEWTKILPSDPVAWLMKGIFLGAFSISIGILNALYFAEKGKKCLEKSYLLSDGIIKAYAAATLGRMYFKLPPFPLSFGDLNKAATFLKEAVQLDPENPYYYVFLAELLAYRGKIDQAMNIIRKIPHLRARNWLDRIAYIWTMRIYNKIVDEIKCGLKGKYNKYTYDFLADPGRHPGLFKKKPGKN